MIENLRCPRCGLFTDCDPCPRCWPVAKRAPAADDAMWQPPAQITIAAKLGHWLCDGEAHVRALLAVLTKQGGYLSAEQLEVVRGARHWCEVKP